MRKTAYTAVVLLLTACTGWGQIQILTGANGHQKCGSGSSCTTTALDSTGATLILLMTACDGSAACTVSDSKSNAWTALTTYASGADHATIFYSCGPTVGPGHTFTFNGSFPGGGAMLFSGTATSNCFDTGTDKGGTAGTTTAVSCASLTPSQTGELIAALTGADQNVTSYSIDSGLTIADSIPTDGSSESFGDAYLVDNNTSSIGPTWTTGSAGTLTAACAAFKPASGGAACRHLLSLMGAGCS